MFVDVVVVEKVVCRWLGGDKTLLVSGIVLLCACGAECGKSRDESSVSSEFSVVDDEDHLLSSCLASGRYVASVVVYSRTTLSSYGTLYCML